MINAVLIKTVALLLIVSFECSCEFPSLELHFLWFVTYVQIQVPVTSNLLASAEDAAEEDGLIELGLLLSDTTWLVATVLNQKKDCSKIDLTLMILKYYNIINAIITLRVFKDALQI